MKQLCRQMHLESEKEQLKMTESLLITAIIAVGLMIILAGATIPDNTKRRQRRLEDQMASEKPFQMGSDPNGIDKKKPSFSEDT